MPRRRGRVRAFAGRFVIALVTAIAVMVGGVLAVNFVIDAKLSKVSRVTLRTAVVTSGPLNFLVVGSDTRSFTNGNSSLQQQFGNEAQNGGQRSDTMMVIRIDPARHITQVVSFPRDLWVQVPGMGLTKINAAYNVGPQLVINMLKQDFNLNINHFIAVNFKSFQGVVNAIGSVHVYVPYQARDTETGLYTPVPGCETFTGADALAYVRSRELQYYSPSQGEWLSAYAVPDIDRIAAQQQFIKTLAGLAVKSSLSNPLTANAVVNRVLENLTIDSGLSKDDVLSLVDAFRSVNPNNTGQVQFATLPVAEGGQQDGQDVLYAAEPQADALLAHLGGMANPAMVSINGNAPPATPGATSAGSGTSTSSSTATSTTTTTTRPAPPSSLTKNGALGAAPTPQINNKGDFGTPAPKAAPC